MRLVCVIAALSFSAVSFADEVPTIEAFSNALQVVRSYRKAHGVKATSSRANLIQNTRASAKEYAKRLNLSEESLMRMKRRLQVLNATTNRPVVGVLESRTAKAGVREKMEKLLSELREETRKRIASDEIIDRIRASAADKKEKYCELEKKAVTNTMRTIYAELVEANQEIIDWCDSVR